MRSGAGNPPPDTASSSARQSASDPVPHPAGGFPRGIAAPSVGPAPRPLGPSRRRMLAGGAVAAGGLLGLGAASRAAALSTGSGPFGAASFGAVAASKADTVMVPDGFATSVLAPWGLPLQAGRVGSHHHGLHFLPLARGAAGNRRGLLVINHESSGSGTRAAQGISVVAVRSSGTGWHTVEASQNRRITPDTPVRFSGPVAADPAPGVLACSGHGITPWGTFLAAEENFNAYFGTDDSAWRRTETDIRYDLSASGFGHPWHRTDPRFDLASATARPDAFGWIVELDPHDPSSVPVKRTALGRFMHGGATVTEAAGRVVVHSTDAEDGEYLYKYVSSDTWRGLRARGRSPLDHGTLHVARIAPDGTGVWLPLTHGTGPLTRAAGWRDQADVLVRARLAADALGATRLGRPERVAVSPADGRVYLALANSSGDATCASQALPGSGAARKHGRAADPYGRVLRWREDNPSGGDGFAHTFRWETFLTAGDPGLTPDGLFASPKGLWFGTDGTLWVSTGISGHRLNGPDPVHEAAGNNALLAADTTTGTVRRFLTAPRGAEITGVSATPDGRTLFVNVQHPGEHPTTSNWPGLPVGGPPRSATVAVQRTSRV
ncbi:DUF839 domain-containing protein [Streptomyces turgidiscabies]|uniref:PhoX family protein n=1 Tax=Streptomyces turgidiscabies TaxID=85558 RepID=UPI0029BF07EB|nr:alkaline phosphatase PhoX [Streptomyces turgidiscabies]MDX3498170.1 DUF839 domain-containing protein [Streptomyces turgidiscabies]